MQLEFHPAANEFPLLDEKRLQNLADDIEANGQREPICLYGGKIIDGRNRYKACLLKNISPKTEELPTEVDPFSYVWSLNGERRDLTADQRYLIWKSCNEKSAEWQEEQRKIQEEANKKRAEAAKKQENRANQYTKKETTTPGIEEIEEQRKEDMGEDYYPLDAYDEEIEEENKEVEVVPQPVAAPPKKPERSSAAKAKASKTNRGSVERMDRLDRERPDLAEKVRIGEMKSAEAIRIMNRDKNKEKIEKITENAPDELSGTYDVVVIDPPWPMQKIERDERPNQVNFDYPTMSEAELAALEIPAADNCHMWLWTTHKFMPMAFRLLKEWGFRYVCTFVWHKPGGFQPIGLPQYNCEFALYARRGSPQFFDTKAFPVCFNAPRGKHSEKPEEFYDVLRRTTAGKRIDMFNRRKIEGFEGWGKEAI